MKKSYINGMSCISAQPTSGEDFFHQLPISYHSTVFKAHPVDYSTHIKPVSMRRMSQSIKMGVYASYMALEDAGVQKPDAIITGTGRGCRQDSETFLEKVLENQEAFLTPIKFIQSTHNSVGGRIALELDSNVYNFTYVQSEVSFQSALLDAHLMILGEKSVENVLVGGIDELAKNSVELDKKNGHIKQEPEIHNLDLLNYKTKGSLASEGATFFVVSKEKTSNTYAELMDVELFNQASEREMQANIQQFLKNNNMKLEDLDAVVLGNNGDSNFDHYYENLQHGIFKNKVQLYYKHLVGEHHTVSAFAMWLGAKILKQQFIPEWIKLNNINPPKSVRNMLLYNQNGGRNHSLILMKAC